MGTVGIQVERKTPGPGARTRPGGAQTGPTKFDLAETALLSFKIMTKQWASVGKVDKELNRKNWRIGHEWDLLGIS